MEAAGTAGSDCQDTMKKSVFHIHKEDDNVKD